MNEKNIRTIARKKEVKEEEIFVSFLSKRFPNEDDRITSYFEEWADMFNSGHPERHMDSMSLIVYTELLRDENKEMRCSLDGNALSIVRPDFINLQESPSMFIDLTEEQIKEFKKLEEK